MPIVHYFATGALAQVEGFPEDTEKKPFKRSREGALHLRPNSTLELTLDEFNFIRENHKELARSMRVLAYLPNEAKPPDKPEWNDAPQIGPLHPEPEATSDDGAIKYEEVENEPQVLAPPPAVPDPVPERARNAAEETEADDLPAEDDSQP